LDVATFVRRAAESEPSDDQFEGMQLRLQRPSGEAGSLGH
jgi:hypothetical protein